jgi:hypothetical protein
MTAWRLLATAVAALTAVLAIGALAPASPGPGSVCVTVVAYGETFEWQGVPSFECSD